MGSKLKFVKFQGFEVDRQNQVTVILQSGSYIVLPVTTGTLMQRRTPKRKDAVILANNKISPEFRSTAIDIFRKFDLLLNWEMSYNEFKVFYRCLEMDITENEFEGLLNKYASTKQGLTC